MAHVGNRNQQAPALAAAHLGGLAIHGIVEIAGVFAVYGDQGNIGQVDPAFFVRRTHHVRQGTGLGHGGITEFMRHAVFAHGDFNFHAGVVDLTQHFLDAPYRLAKQRRRLGQLDHDDLPRLGGAGGPLGDQHILAITLVFGRDQPDTAFLQQAADDGIGRALQDFRDAAFGPVFTVVPHDARLDAVLVQHGAHFVGRQVNIGLAVVALDKTMAITVAKNGALEFCEESGRCAGILIGCFDKSLFLFEVFLGCCLF
ncbi:hypothetical protein D9M73_80320 [compost metagenome]